ncbi:MAG: RecX family transcriptional regulator [Desulfobacterales bacterium]
MPSEDPAFRRALTLALRFLSRRDHSARELSGKLERKGVEAEIVRGVIEECRRLGYIDESRSAAQLAQSLRRRGFGMLRLRRDLLRRGLLSTEEDRLPPGVWDPAEEAAAALQAARKKWAALQGDEESALVRKAKLERFLRARGFSAASIREALSRVAEIEPPPQ